MKESELKVVEGIRKMAAPLLYAKADDGYLFKLSHGHEAVLQIGLNGSSLIKPGMYFLCGVFFFRIRTITSNSEL